MKGALIVFAAAIAVSTASVVRIAGGSTATIAQYRYAASMLYGWTATTFTYRCGGVIVTNNAIVSAAVCYDGDLASRWEVRVGSVRADSGGTVYRISSITPQSTFVSNTLVDNIAVLRTATNIVFGTSVQPANLAATTLTLTVDTELFAVGWGATQFGGSNAARLQHAAVRIIDSTSCSNSYTGLTTTLDATTMVCVGVPTFGGRGQCDGDEGSALVLKVDSNVNNDVVVGLFSWTRECALAQYPGVNTLISAYREWIYTTANS